MEPLVGGLYASVRSAHHHEDVEVIAVGANYVGFRPKTNRKTDSGRRHKLAREQFDIRFRLLRAPKERARS